MRECIQNSSPVPGTQRVQLRFNPHLPLLIHLLDLEQVCNSNFHQSSEGAAGYVLGFRLLERSLNTTE